MGMGQVADIFIKQRKLIVSKGPGGDTQFVKLFLHFFYDSGVTMALINSRIGSQAVHVLVAFNIPDPDPFASFKDDIQRFVVFGTKFVFQFNDFFGIHLVLPFMKNLGLFVLNSTELKKS